MASQFHLADLFEAVAATVPDRIAIESDSLRLTYAELDDRSDRLAAGLAAHGVGAGDTAGLYMANRAEYLEAFIALIKLGAVPFNVNYRYREEELCHLFANAGAAVIVHGAQFSPIVRAVRLRLPAIRLAVAVEDGSGGSDRLGGSDGSGADIAGSIAYDTLLQAAPAKGWARSEQDIVLTYTGGTTGMPKGVMWPHKAFLFACAGGAGYFNPLGPLDRPEGIAERVHQSHRLLLFPLAPLMHAAALWTTWSALLNGLTIVLDESPTFDAVAVWDKVARLGVNIVQIVGDAMAVPLRDALRAHPGRWNLAALVHLGSGGAVFSQHVKHDLQALLPSGVAILDGMGSSETGVSGAAQASSEGMMRLPGGDHQRVVIDGRFAQPGETGLVARSGHVPIGYFGDPESSAKVFQRIAGQVWAVSGDSARQDADGTIVVFGRGSTSINSGGEKIFPEEVEEALRAHPAILDAVVAGQPDTRWGERVVAIVASRPGTARPDQDTLRLFLADRLAGYKVPKALVWVDEVRRSPAGKQDYRWARAMAATA